MGRTTPTHEPRASAATAEKGTSLEKAVTNGTALEVSVLNAEAVLIDVRAKTVIMLQCTTLQLRAGIRMHSQAEQSVYLSPDSAIEEPA